MPSAGSRLDISRVELLGGVSGAAKSHPGLPATFAGVAQSVEHLFCKQAVRGSSPLPSSNPSTARTEIRDFCGGTPHPEARAQSMRTRHS